MTLCRRSGLPVPEPNVQIGPCRVDFLWRDAGLVVEVDDWKSHRGRRAFEDDRTRDADLAERGLTVIRFTDRQIRTEPTSVTAALETMTSRLDIVATANESLEPPP